MPLKKVLKTFWEIIADFYKSQILLVMFLFCFKTTQCLSRKENPHFHFPREKLKKIPECLVMQPSQRDREEVTIIKKYGADSSFSHMWKHIAPSRVY